jgi:hypothetical protein
LGELPVFSPTAVDYKKSPLKENEKMQPVFGEKWN